MMLPLLTYFCCGLQALGPGDPNYLDDVPPDAMPQQGATFGDALQAASMSTMPTGGHQ